MFNCLPAELNLKIFSELSYADILRCRLVNNESDRFIRWYPWNHLKIQIYGTSHLKYFLLHFNFQVIKICNPDIQLDDDIWHMLFNRHKVTCRCTNIASIFDQYPCEIIRNVPNPYILFNKSVKIHYTPYIVNHLITIPTEFRGSLLEILKTSLDPYVASVYPAAPYKIRLHLNTKNNSAYPSTIKLITQQLHCSCYKISKINNTDELKYYMYDWFLSIIGSYHYIPDGHRLLSLLLAISSMTVDKSLLEELRKILSDSGWAHTFQTNITNNQYIRRNVFHFYELTYADLCFHNRHRAEQLYGCNHSFDIDKKAHSLLDHIFLINPHLCHGANIEVITTYLLEAYRKYLKKLTIWDCPKEFIKYHPNYVHDLREYNETSFFSLTDNFIQKVKQKNKFADLWFVLKENVFLQSKIQNKMQNTINQEISPYANYLTDKYLFQSYLRKEVIKSYFNPQTMNWSINHMSNTLIQKMYTLYHKIQNVNLTKLLLEGNFDVANQVVMLKMPFDLDTDSCIQGEFKPTILEFLISNQLMPHRITFMDDIKFDTIIWFTTRAQRLTIIFSDGIEQTLQSLNHNGSHICIQATHMDQRQKQFYKFIRALNSNGYQVPDSVLWYLFQNAINASNIKTLEVLHEYYQVRVMYTCSQNPSFKSNFPKISNIAIVFLAKKNYFLFPYEYDESLEDNHMHWSKKEYIIMQEILNRKNYYSSLNKQLMRGIMAVSTVINGHARKNDRS